MRHCWARKSLKEQWYQFSIGPLPMFWQLVSIFDHLCNTEKHLHSSAPNLNRIVQDSRPAGSGKKELTDNEKINLTSRFALYRTINKLSSTLVEGIASINSSIWRNSDNMVIIVNSRGTLQQHRYWKRCSIKWSNHNSDDNNKNIILW